MNRRSDKKVDELTAEIEELEKMGGQETIEKDPPKTTPNQETTPEKEVEPEEGNWKKRFGDLRRHSQAKEKEWEEKLKELETKLQAAPTSIPTSEAQIKEWAQNNPQAASIIRAIAKEQSKPDAQLTARLAEIEKRSEELSKREIEARIKKVHSDFDTITEDNAFHDWAETQPKFIQDKIYDNDDADDVIWAVTLYKKENGIKPVDNTREAARSVSTSTKTSSPGSKPSSKFSESSVKKMSPEEFEKNWDGIEKSMQDGSFVYDLTGAAR